jgi:hypothetical protein
MIASASPNYNPGFPRVHATQSHLAPESPRVTALAVGDTPLRWTRVPTGRDNGETGWLHSGIAASPTAVAATRLRSGTVGHNNMRLDFNAAFRGLKESGIGREGLLPYLQSETVLLDEAARSHCHCATGS